MVERKHQQCDRRDGDEDGEDLEKDDQYCPGMPLSACGASLGQLRIELLALAASDRS
jgi:hypothetical protein